MDHYLTDSDTDLFPTDNTKAEAAQLISDSPENKAGKSSPTGRKIQNFLTRNGKFPSSIYYIIGNEFCERFSFYGMKTILVIYLTQRLGFHADPATAIYHGFTMLCYFTPLFGAILADGLLGKFRTILYISIIYGIGNIVMALTALPPPEWIGMAVGLFLIGIGTGGIKPCVAAFGGDQFSSDQEKELQAYFSVFYFAINAGSLLSTFLTPILRADVECFGADCYPLAFGVPAMLMILSLVIFFCGRKQYKNNPPTGSLIGRVLKCIWYGIRKKFSSVSAEQHWLDRTTTKFEPEFVDEVKCLLKVLTMFLPLPIFWALFDQQGSRWTLQAEHMNGQIVNDWRIKPDQMQAINPILILVLIPIFEKLIYPALDQCKLPNRPLQRMVSGMVVAVLAFLVAGFLQIKLDKSIEKPLTFNESAFTIINSSPCRLTVTSHDLEYDDVIGPYMNGVYFRTGSGNYSVTMATDKSCSTVHHMTRNIPLASKNAYRFLITQNNEGLQFSKFMDSREKPRKGNASVSLIYLTSDLDPSTLTQKVMLKNGDESLILNTTGNSPSQFLPISPGKFGVYTLQDLDHSKYTGKSFDLDNGAVYTVVMATNSSAKQASVHLYVGLYPNHVSMAYQIPQYILITMAEVMFSITGLSFAYSQAPPSMKSVLQAAWLLTIAVGNLIVLIVAEVKLVHSQSLEFFLFAGLMGLDVIIFAAMTTCYKYTNQNQAKEIEFEDTVGLVKTD